jgi:hypothetical protein
VEAYADTDGDHLAVAFLHHQMDGECPPAGWGKTPRGEIERNTGSGKDLWFEADKGWPCPDSNRRGDGRDHQGFPPDGPRRGSALRGRVRAPQDPGVEARAYQDPSSQKNFFARLLLPLAKASDHKVTPSDLPRPATTVPATLIGTLPSTPTLPPPPPETITTSSTPPRKAGGRSKKK